MARYLLMAKRVLEKLLPCKDLIYMINNLKVYFLIIKKFSILKLKKIQRNYSINGDNFI